MCLGNFVSFLFSWEESKQLLTEVVCEEEGPQQWEKEGLRGWIFQYSGCIHVILNRVMRMRKLWSIYDFLHWPNVNKCPSSVSLSMKVLSVSSLHLLNNTGNGQRPGVSWRNSGQQVCFLLGLSSLHCSTSSFPDEWRSCVAVLHLGDKHLNQWWQKYWAFGLLLSLFF